METTPKIQEYMSLVPRTVGQEATVTQAEAMMKENEIRHLPVIEAGRLVGVVSERDIKLGRSFPGPGELTVGDVMVPNPYVVGPDAFLDEVASEMIKHKLGSAIVQLPSGKVVGIFTMIDALRVLQHLLGTVTVRKAA